MLSLYTMHYWTDLRQDVTQHKCFLTLRLNNWKMFSSLWHLWTWGHKGRFWDSSECKTFILICCFAVEIVFFCFFRFFYLLLCFIMYSCWAVQYVVYTNRLGHSIVIGIPLSSWVYELLREICFKVHVYCIHN